ncbi:MAG TPA: hypothetical protein DIC60_04605 [Lachnospiraceae bacterium]|nr:hypothetical protein [Lachnospiraceae bacterium]
MAIGWNFPNNNNGEIVGIETFKGSLFSSLAREICQNSLDARVDNTKPVRIEFALKNIKRDNIYGIEDLTEAVELCKKYWQENKKTVDFFTNAIKVCHAEQLRVLRISDFNTTGLIGSDKIKSSPWQDLVKSSGVSNKSGELGGSFGIGKSAPFACSELRTIFYNTLDINGIKAYQGVAKLVSFQYPGKQRLFATQKGEITQGKGYYGETTDNSAVKENINIDDYKRIEIGTDVFILGFINHSEWKSEVIKSVVNGYLISILQNDLEVIVDGTPIDAKTINGLIEEFKEDLPLAYNYYQVLTDENSVCIKEDFEGLGELELRVLIQKNFRRKVLMARNNGMKIFDKDNISGTIQFAGVCILKAKELNGYFRQMENPQHNNWEPDRFSEDEKLKKQAKKMKTTLFKFIKNKILEIGKSTVLDEMDALGAGEFIPDINVSTGEEGNKTESINNEIKNYTPIEKSKNIKIDKGAQIIEDTNVKSEDFGFGDIDSDGNLPTTVYEHGNGHRRGGEGENENGHGELSDDGQAPMKKSVLIKPLKLRLFMSDSKNKTYKLTFTTDKSAKDVYIELTLSGEQSNTNVEVKDARLTNDTMLMHKSNRIFIGNIEENNTYSVLYSIKYNEMCSMGVVIHGYKI